MDAAAQVARSVHVEPLERGHLADLLRQVASEAILLRVAAAREAGATAAVRAAAVRAVVATVAVARATAMVATVAAARATAVAATVAAARAAAARAAAGSAAAAARARDAPEVQGGRQYSQHWWFGL